MSSFSLPKNEAKSLSSVKRANFSISASSGLDVISNEGSTSPSQSVVNDKNIKQQPLDSADVNSPLPLPSPKSLADLNIDEICILCANLKISCENPLREHHVDGKLFDLVENWKELKVLLCDVPDIKLKLLYTKLEEYKRVGAVNPSLLMTNVRNAAVVTSETKETSAAAKSKSKSTTRQENATLPIPKKKGKNDRATTVIGLTGNMHEKVTVSAKSKRMSFIQSQNKDKEVRIAPVTLSGSTLSGHDGEVWSVIQLRDGRVCSGSADSTLKIWNLLTGEAEKTLSGHGYVWSVIELRDGRMCSGSGDKTLKIWSKFETYMKATESSRPKRLSYYASPSGSSAPRQRRASDYLSKDLAMFAPTSSRQNTIPMRFGAAGNQNIDTNLSQH